MKLYSYFDGKTLFSQIFLGCIFFFFLGGGGVGGLDKSSRLSPVGLTMIILGVLVHDRDRCFVTSQNVQINVFDRKSNVYS